MSEHEQEGIPSPEQQPEQAPPPPPPPADQGAAPPPPPPPPAAGEAPPPPPTPPAGESAPPPPPPAAPEQPAPTPPPAGQAQPPQQAPQAPSGGTDEKTLAMLAHALAIIAGFLAPLIIYLIANDKPRAKESAKEALNFQITVAIAWVGALIIGTLLTLVPVIGWLFSIILWLAVFGIWVANVVFCILAAVAVNNGQDYRYPFALRLVK